MRITDLDTDVKFTLKDTMEVQEVEMKDEGLPRLQAPRYQKREPVPAVEL